MKAKIVGISSHLKLVEIDECLFGKKKYNQQETGLLIWKLYRLREKIVFAFSFKLDMK